MLKCLEKINDAWFYVILDDSNRVLSCGFSVESEEDATKSILSSDPSSETCSNEYALSILDSMGQIYNGKDASVAPELAWERLPPFYTKALKLTFLIPKGMVATYGGIAEGVGDPKAARAVGNAEASNPFAPFVPCHRVISSSLGLGGYGGSLDVKKALLIKEGIIFDQNRVVRECVWMPKTGELL